MTQEQLDPEKFTPLQKMVVEQINGGKLTAEDCETVYTTLLDIANHGCSGGVHGFIYYGPMEDFYHADRVGRIDDRLAEYLDEVGTTFPEWIKANADKSDIETTPQLIGQVCWLVVELVAQELTQEKED